MSEVEHFIVAFNLLGDEGSPDVEFTSLDFINLIIELGTENQFKNMKSLKENVYNFLTRLSMGAFVSKRPLENAALRGPRVIYTKVANIQKEETWIFTLSYTSAEHRIGLERQAKKEAEAIAVLDQSTYEKYKQQYVAMVNENLALKEEIKQLKDHVPSVDEIIEPVEFDWSFLDNTPNQEV